MSDHALIADIGGTNARFALADFKGDEIAIGNMRAFRAEDFPSIEIAAGAFLDAVGERPKRACFAVAAPVADRVIAFTNSPWTLDIGKLKAALGLDRLLVLNDFEALALGVRRLPKRDLAPVKPGVAASGAPILVVGPGTGFGQALVLSGPDGDQVVPTEGGHVGFAPQGEEEIEILKFISREHKRASIERILSGPGLVNIHRALCAVEGTPPIYSQADEITRAALAAASASAVKTIDLFCALLGSAAGDAVLGTGARGGVVLGGGILPRIKDLFLKSRFAERFVDKGRMRAYVEAVPVDLIIRDGAALIGAAARLRAADVD